MQNDTRLKFEEHVEWFCTGSSPNFDSNTKWT